MSGKEVKQYYYAEIEKLSKRFAVIWLCEIFGLSRSGYYKWLQRKGQENRYQKTQRILDEHIAALHKAHPSSGYRALNARLRVTQSMSRAGTPRDNAVMESIFGWFKDFLKADFFPSSS